MVLMGVELSIPNTYKGHLGTWNHVVLCCLCAFNYNCVLFINIYVSDARDVHYYPGIFTCWSIVWWEDLEACACL